MSILGFWYRVILQPGTKSHTFDRRWPKLPAAFATGTDDTGGQSHIFDRRWLKIIAIFTTGTDVLVRTLSVFYSSACTMHMHYQPIERSWMLLGLDR